MTDLLKLGKKVFTVSVVALTILWSVGISALVPTVALAVTCPTLQAGDLFKVPNNSSVYLVNGDMKRMYFFNAEVYKTWYKDYSGIQTIDTTCTDAYPSGGAVSYRPGSFLLKTPISPTVYAVTGNGQLTKIQDMDSAAALYGANWGKLVRDANDAYFGTYTPAAGAVSDTPHNGMLVKKSTGSTYFVQNGKLTLVDGTLSTILAGDVRTVSDAVFAKLEVASGSVTSATILANANTIATTPTTPNPTVAGALTVSLNANTPAARNVPNGTSVEFLRLNLAASNDNDVNVTGIKFSAVGLGTYTDIDAVTVLNNGVRYGTARDVDSNKVAQINFTTPLVVKKGTTETVVVKATILASQTGHYALGVAAAANVTANVTVGGSYPINGNEQTGATVNTATLTMSDNGSLANVKLGDVQGTVGKFKLANDNYEDVTFNSIRLKKDSTTSTVADADFVNYTLTVDGAVVATAASMSNRYVDFNLNTPVTILKNGTKTFTVKADAVSGASKKLQLILDANSDLVATGNYYMFPVKLTSTFVGGAVTINAGAVTVERVNAAVVKVNKSQTDVVLGTLKVTVNSGKTTELSTLKLTVASTNDNAGLQIENFEVYLKNTNTVYDLTSSTGNGIYKNTSMGLVLNSGTTYEFIVRADTKSTASNGDYAVTLSDAAGGAMVLKETGNDTLVSDITPNTVSLNKVSIETSSMTFSKNALSAAYNAVVGVSNVELLNFNIKASTASDVKVTSLEFRDALSTSTKSVVSEFKLWKGNDLVKTVSANDLATFKIPFNDLSEVVGADKTVTYKLTASVVNDSNLNGKQMQWELSAYTAEETLKSTSVYDTAVDSNSDGTVATGAFTSGRVVTIRGYGYLDIAVDNTIPATQYDTYNLAGTNGVPVATFKFKAGNEDIKVTQLNVVASSAVTSTVSRISLYDGDTEVAYSTQIGATTTTLDQDFVVSGQKYYTLKVNLLPIGQDMAGVVNIAATFRLNAVTAEGVSSGYTLTADDANATNDAGTIGYEVDSVATLLTAVSKTMGVVASKIGSVALLPSVGSTALASSLFSGTPANAAIVAVTLPAMNNKNGDASALKFALNNMKLKLDQGGTWTGYTATLERIGGSGTATSTVNGLSGTSTVSMQFALDTNNDWKITPNSANPVTAYFLVKVTPVFSTTNPGDTAMTVGLDGLDGTTVSSTNSGTVAGTAAFKWTDLDGQDSVGSYAAAKFPLRIPGVTYVNGVLIHN